MKFGLLKILKLGLTFLGIILFSINGMAQYKSYQLTDKGDTINAITNAGLKQGKWIIHVDELRGEPGYEEEGVFDKGKKEGVWKQFSLTGDLIGIENYKFGGKDGVQQYYTYLGDIIREESWRGYNPDAPYDTIPVYGAGNGEIVDYKIVKAVQYSVKHGEWKYYDPKSGNVIKTERYDRGLLEKNVAPVATVTADNKTKKPDKTPEMIEWEKKNKGKKKVLRDGQTRIQ